MSAGFPFNSARLDWPPKVLNPNARTHYLVRHRVASRYRDHARIMGLSGRLLAEPVVVLLPICKDSRRRDLDNILAATKSGIDGLTDAQWWKDDHDIRAWHVVPEVKVDSLYDHCIVMLATEERNLSLLTSMVQSFRAAAAAGNAHSAAHTILRITL